MLGLVVMEPVVDRADIFALALLSISSFFSPSDSVSLVRILRFQNIASTRRLSHSSGSITTSFRSPYWAEYSTALEGQEVYIAIQTQALGLKMLNKVIDFQGSTSFTGRLCLTRAIHGIE